MNTLASGIRMLGYCDDWHASPGSTIAFKVSCDGIDSYRVRIGRVICADLDPLGPGFRIEPVERIRPDLIKGRFQPLFPGSFARIDDPDRLSSEQRFSVAAFVWPTLPGRGEQTILSHWDGAAGTGVAVGAGCGRKTGAHDRRMRKGQQRRAIAAQALVPRNGVHGFRYGIRKN